MDFFRLHPEKRIGLKKLTDADLGLSNSSRQTHIGLYEGVLEYLEDSDVIKKGLLVYKNNTCFFILLHRSGNAGANTFRLFTMPAIHSNGQCIVTVNTHS